MLVRQTISLNTAGKQQQNTNNKERWKSGAYNISVRHRVLLIVLKCHMVFLYPQHGLLILKSPPATVVFQSELLVVIPQPLRKLNQDAQK